MKAGRSQACIPRSDLLPLFTFSFEQLGGRGRGGGAVLVSHRVCGHRVSGYMCVCATIRMTNGFADTSKSIKI